MYIRKLLIVAILGFIIISSGCIFLPGRLTEHDTLIVALESLPTSLVSWDYLYGDDYVGLIFTLQLYSFLGMNAPGENIYAMFGLAENWTVNNDRTEWTFTLREGLTFHDETKITAEDIEYSLRAAITYGFDFYYMDNTSDPAFNDFFNFTYQSPDSLTFTISSTVMLPNPVFEWQFSGALDALGPLYAIVPKNCFETNSSKEAFRKQPVSAGPYMIASPEDIIEEESFLLTRFDGWFGWGKTFTASNGQQYSFPTVDKAFKYVKFRAIEDASSRLLYINSKELDVGVFDYDLPYRNDIDKLNASSEFSVHEFDNIGGTILQLNIQGDWPQIFGGPGNFPVSEIWFRKAISHAISRTTIVDNVFQGFGSPWNSFYPEWILEMYPNLVTDSYYDFSFNLDKAKEILDINGYPPVNFTDEPSNRFGWGLYANETTIDGVEQTKGRHFILDTPVTHVNQVRGVEIKKLLRNIGIYVDIEIPIWNEFMERKYGTPGMYYDNETIPQPDPNYQGVEWDFRLPGWGDFYDTPSLPFLSFGSWYFYGDGSAGWFNAEYETARAKIYGGKPGNYPDYYYRDTTLWEFMPPPPDMPEGGYPIPEWTNDDPQFMEGCSIAGKILSNDLPVIPINHYPCIFIKNVQVKNLKFALNDYFHAAYAYWEN